MAKLNLTLVKETPDARLYQLRDGSLRWIPRSIVEHTTKNPGGHHIVTIPDWKLQEWDAEDAEAKRAKETTV